MRLRLEYKWIVGVVFVFGLFMELLDTTITNVALPTLAEEFNVSHTTIEWVVTGYLLSLAAFIPVSGWAGDRFGTKRIFMIALALFTMASFMCGLAWSVESLIAFRILQGVGGGMLMPVGTAMLFRAFPPEERAQAGALLTIPTVVAPASGPIIGGYLVEYHSWHWIFFINVPIGILGVIVAGLFLREEKQPNPGRFDLPGFILSAAGLTTLLYALAEAGSRGFDDPLVLAFGATGLALLGSFAIVEMRTAEPMIDVRLLGNKLFRAMNLVQLFGYGGMMGALFLLPLLLQSQMGLSPLESGLTTFPQAIGVVLMAQVAGRLYGHIGPKRLLMAGLLIVMLSTLSFVAVQLDTNQWWIRGVMLIRGFGFAMMLVPLQTATYATISPQDTGRASAIYNANRQVAASFGVALLATVLANRLSVHGAELGNPATSQEALLAFHDAFFAAAILAAVGMVVAAIFVDDKLAAGTMRQRERPEAVVAPTGGD